MDNILDKLDIIDDETHDWDNWSLEQKKRLLELYFTICKKEAHIFDLIYRHHPCDSWEDIFRDYSTRDLHDKAQGVEIAIQGITEEMEEAKSNKQKSA